jgi:hypothetical protein
VARQIGQDGDSKRDDDNRNRRLVARRRLEEMLDLAEQDDFYGKVTVEITAAGGSLGRVRTANDRYDN